VVSITKANSSADIAIAITVKGLGSELHIVFGLVIAGALIFSAFSIWQFSQSRSRRRRREQRRRERSAARQRQREGYEPPVPIQVHMVQDEEVLDMDIDLEEGSPIEEKPIVPTKIPPPAYGLWRESVKLNPELLFWAQSQKAKQQKEEEEERAGDGERQGPRPPSYLSDDGVSYVVGAQPRSTVSLGRPMDQLHQQGQAHPASRGLGLAV
jgi:hypothetical protein